MLTFQGVTPEVFALVLDQLRAEARVTWLADSTMKDELGALSGRVLYRIEGSGVDSEVSQFIADRHIEVDIKHKPFYVSEGMIGAKIRDAITLAQQAVAKAGQGGPERAA